MISSLLSVFYHGFFFSFFDVTLMVTSLKYDTLVLIFQLELRAKKKKQERKFSNLGEESLPLHYHRVFQACFLPNLMYLCNSLIGVLVLRLKLLCWAERQLVMLVLTEKRLAAVVYWMSSSRIVAGPRAGSAEAGANVTRHKCDNLHSVF